MARKTSLVPSRIFTFGCLPSISGENGEKLIEEQLLAAHTHYNDLTTIELERRESYRAARRKVCPLLEDHEKEVERLNEEIEQAEGRLLEIRQKDQKKGKHPELEQAIKTLKAVRKVLCAALKDERKAVASDEQLRAISKEIDAVANQKGKQAREATKAYWGTYLLVEAAVKAASRCPMDPVLKKRFSGEGRIGVQLQDPLTTQQLMAGGNTYLKMDPLPADQWKTRSGRRHAYTVIHIRVGSEKRNPVWVSFPVLIHRRLPEGIIKWAWVQMFRVGTRIKYELQLSLESNDFLDVPHPARNEGTTYRPRGKGIIAIYLGWNVQEQSVQIGQWQDDQGRSDLTPKEEGSKDFSGPFELTEGVRQAMAYADALRGIGDRHFDRVKAEFQKWLAGGGFAPAWAVEDLTTLGQWRSRGRLARLVGQWVGEFFPKEEILSLWEAWKTLQFSQPGKGELFAHVEIGEDGLDVWMRDRQNIDVWLRNQGLDETQRFVAFLEFWRRKNRHLYQWECDVRNKAIGRRNNEYRQNAAWLAKTYETVIVNKLDLKTESRSAATESDAPRLQAIRLMKKHVSLGIFQEAIISAVSEPSDKSTHPRKGKEKRFVKLGDVKPVQGEHPAKSLLKAYFDSFGADQNPAPARMEESTQNEPDPQDEPALDDYDDVAE